MGLRIDVEGGEPTDGSAALHPHNIEKAVSRLQIDGNVQFVELAWGVTGRIG